MSSKSFSTLLIIMSLMAIALLILKVEDRPLKDELMAKFLSMPVQDRADFISANLTPEMLHHLSIIPCGEKKDD